MLQNLREHARGWVAGIIVAILCLAFSLWGVEYYLGADSSNGVVAKVNKTKITQQQLESAYQRLRQEVITNNPKINLDQETQRLLKEQTLKQLIHRVVLADAATKAGYRIGPEQLNSVVLQFPAFQVNGLFSPELFRRTLNNLLYTQQEFLQSLQQNMLIIQAQTAITEGDFVLPSEVDRAITDLNQKRNVTYAVIPAVKVKSMPSGQDIQSYYEKNQKNFMAPEQISLAYIELSAKDLAQQAQPSEQEIAQYYQANQQQFSRSEQWHLARILISVPVNASREETAKLKQTISNVMNQAKKGDNFGQLAKTYSADKETAVRGGVMPWISRTQQNNPFAKVASQLKPGQVSEVFETQEGFNIVKLLAIKETSIQSLSEAKEQITQFLKQQKLQQLYDEKSDQLANLTFTHPDTLEPAAQALNVPIKTTELFTNEGTKTGLSANPKIINAAFHDTVLKQGSNSDVIQLDPETLVVLRIHKHIPTQLHPLNEVKPQIIQDLQVQTARNETEEKGKAVISALEKNKSLTEVARKYDFVWKHASNVTRQTSEYPAQLLSAFFSVPKSDANLKNSITHYTAPNGDFFVVVVNQVIDGDPQQASSKERTQTEQQLATAYSKVDEVLYVQQQMKNAHIKINQK